jgi:hypothetical protein
MLALCPTIAHALTAEQCAFTATVVEHIAKAHQNEVPLAKLLPAVEALVTGESARAAARRIVVAVYQEPRYRTDEAKQRFINEWRDRVHAECLKGLD